MQNPTLGDYLRALAAEPGATSKPALVVQGGGLRAIYSMAALAALDEQGLRDAFSIVVGSSAGGINGAYFLAGQAAAAVSIYSEDLSGRRFVTPWRLWRIVDIDYMIDVALKQHCPLDVPAVRRAGAELFIVLTDADTGRPYVVSMRDDRFDPYEVFRATAALPSLYNKRIPVGEGRYIDGGIAENVPLASSRSLGATEALVVLTRPPGYRRRDHGQAYRLVGRLMAAGQSTRIKATIGAADAGYNSTMEELEQERTASPRTTWSLRPSDARRLVERTTNDRALLRDCAAMAREDVIALLDEPHQSEAAAL